MRNRTLGLIQKIPHYQELTRFGTVGVSAAAVNFAMVLLLVSFVHLRPLLANVVAFLTAFQVSYHGHKRWTFGQHNARHVSVMTKFFIVAGLSFILNEGLFALLLRETHLYYPIALLVVLLVIPPITFILSKMWAFRS